MPPTLSTIVEEARLAVQSLVEYAGGLVNPTVRLGVTGHIGADALRRLASARRNGAIPIALTGLRAVGLGVAKKHQAAHGTPMSGPSV